MRHVTVLLPTLMGAANRSMDERVWTAADGTVVVIAPILAMVAQEVGDEEDGPGNGNWE